MKRKKERKVDNYEKEIKKRRGKKKKGEKSKKE